MIRHCLTCGEKHEHKGPCAESSFEYFKCENCGTGQRIPWDAVAFGGLRGMICACGKDASTHWSCIRPGDYHELISK